MSSRNAAFHDGALAGVLLRPLKLGFSVTLGLAAVLLCAWIVDWVFVSRAGTQGQFTPLPFSFQGGRG